MKFIAPQKESAPHDFMKYVLLAFTVAAGAAVLASLFGMLAENRFRRKMERCADSVFTAMPTLRHAAELSIAEHEPEAVPNPDDMPF